MAEQSVPGIDVVTVEAKSDSEDGPIQHQGFLPISTSAAVPLPYRHIITFTFIHHSFGLFLCVVYQSIYFVL